MYIIPLARVYINKESITTMNFLEQGSPTHRPPGFAINSTKTIFNISKC